MKDTAAGGIHATQGTFSSLNSNNICLENLEGVWVRWEEVEYRLGRIPGYCHYQLLAHYSTTLKFVSFICLGKKYESNRP